MSIKHRLRLMVLSITDPVKIIRIIDRDGTKRIIVVRRTLFSWKPLGKFEITQEFATDSFLPHWEPIEFGPASDFRKGVDHESERPDRGGASRRS